MVGSRRKPRSTRLPAVRTSGPFPRGRAKLTQQAARPEPRTMPGHANPDPGRIKLRVSGPQGDHQAPAGAAVLAGMVSLVATWTSGRPQCAQGGSLQWAESEGERICSGCCLSFRPPLHTSNQVEFGNNPRSVTVPIAIRKVPSLVQPCKQLGSFVCAIQVFVGSYSVVRKGRWDSGVCHKKAAVGSLLCSLRRAA
jgi:hypothetical protein